MPGVEGFIYPNEVELQWSVLIVLYPFITGLVAGAFILASLERVFNVEAVRPTYRLALLTALAFLLVAPLPLQLHLGHPERSFEMYLTPHTHVGDGDVRLRLPLVPDGRAASSRSGSTTARSSCCTWRASTGLEALALRRADALVRQHQPGGAARRRPDRPHRHDRRHPVGVPAARLRRLHLRIDQGQPVVVHAADADRVPVLGHRVGHRGRDAALHGAVVAAGERRDRHALPRHDRAVPVLRVRHRLLARDARPDPPHLRGRRVVPRARLHGEDAAVHLADRAPDRRSARSCRIPLLALVQVVRCPSAPAAGSTPRPAC